MSEILNPNCSEAVMRIRTDKMTDEEKEKLLKELEEKFSSAKNEYAGDTSVTEDIVFGIPSIKIDGDEPYNNREEIEKVLDENNVKQDWIEEEEN